MRLHLIKSGFFSCEGGAMFGIVPRKTWERRYPSVDELCPMAMNLILIDFGNRKVLLDTGVGQKNIRKLRSYGFHSLINVAEEIQSLGILPEEVTDVVLSHLHFDHCGGSTHFDEQGELQISFPNATHWVSRSQFLHYQSPTLLDKDSYLTENIDLIQQKGILKLVDCNCELFEGFRLKIFDGHTPGQLVSIFEINDQTYAFVGDVVPTMAHLSPLWISPYDLYPVASVSEKIRLLDEASFNDWTLISFHDTYHPFAKVKKTGNSFKPIYQEEY
jgi:glyoxylase-like metal-dependent hydrolase (beta-lactamase superfamily II)